MLFKDKPFFWFLIAGLATWRITNIIQREEIASPVRRSLGVFEPDGEDPDHWIYPDNFIGKVLHCFWCGSVWVAGAMTVLCLIFPPLILPFAVSALAILVKTWIEREPDLYIENMWAEGEATGEEGDDSDE